MIARSNLFSQDEAAPSIIIDTINHSRGDVLTTYKLKKLAETVLRATLEERDIREAELSVLFVDDEEMAELNQRHRLRKGSTDVLSFPMREGPAVPAGVSLLGDIVISVERARDQAERQGHSVSHEIAVLLIHGLLHLLGYDHEKDAREARQMRRLETACFEALCAQSRLRL